MPSSPITVRTPSQEALLTRLGRVPDPRDPRGVRYPLAGLLAVAVFAVVAGARSFAATGQWAGALSTASLAELGLCQAPTESNLGKLVWTRPRWTCRSPCTPGPAPKRCRANG